MPAVDDPSDTVQLRRRNWLALAIGTIVMMFSYFPYGAAFARPEGEPAQIDPALVGVALVVAPFVFITIGWVSQNAMAPKRVLQSMGLLLMLGLAVGLLSPVLGAAAGFGTGAALCLRLLPYDRTMRNRLWAVVLSTFYVFVLLVVATPAGVFTGGLLPLIAVGFADEYTAWRAANPRSAAPATEI